MVVSNNGQISFEWVFGGNFSVSAMYIAPNGTSTVLNATFTVKAPTNVTATATPYTGGVNGFNWRTSRGLAR